MVMARLPYLAPWGCAGSSWGAWLQATGRQEYTYARRECTYAQSDFNARSPWGLWLPSGRPR
eukprot:356905-Chlamydomonas_euryale.AAC.2